MAYRLKCLIVAILAACTPCIAATVSIDVHDADGKPAADAVVTLTPNGGVAVASHVAEKAIIDQRNETFLPLVVLVRRGGDVVFTNHDTTMHQVYSFSPIKQFQFEIDQGQVSKPVQFDKAGVAAIGCNIHDQMIAYVFAADAPFAVITDAAGRAEIADVPDGAYHAAVWHPRLKIGAPPPVTALTVKGASAHLDFTVPLRAGGMKHMHMDY
jgi:plastocyanin